MQKLCELKRQGLPAALVTIVATQGSTPRKAGAAMVVDRAGRIWGTIGGGCGEAEARQQALTAMDEQAGRLHKIMLLNEVAANEGMVCGGVMELFIQVV